MIDLLDLYNKGHRRFLFSDGVVREPSEVHLHSSVLPIAFNFGYGDIWYCNDGVSCIGYKPSVTGVEKPITEPVNLKRDDDGRWWLEIPLSATVEDIQKAQEVLCSKT